MDCNFKKHRSGTNRQLSHALFRRYLFSVRNPLDPWPLWSGVKHGDELDYVFGRPLSQPEIFDGKDIAISRFIIQSWANFVRTG